MKKMRNIFIETGRDSTVHSIAKISKADNKLIRTIWIVTSIVSVSFCTFLIIKGMNDYFSHDVVTKIRRIKENESEFPAVTFCSNEALLTPRSRMIYEQLIVANNLTTSKKDKLTYSFILNLMNQKYSDEEKQKWGYNIDEMIIDCKFKFIKNCNDQFTKFYHFRYGNCLRFNTLDDTSMGLKYSESSGYLSGLDVDIFAVLLNNMTKLDVNNFGKSIVIFIGNKLFVPNYRESVIIPANAINYIGVSRTIIKKQGEPYSNCLEDLSHSKSMYYEFITKIQNKTYRQLDCMELIRQESIIKKCNCAISFFPKIDPKISYCLSYQDLVCSSIEYFSGKSLKSEQYNYNLCPLECESIEYTLTITSVPITYNTYFLERKYYHNRELFRNISDDEYVSSLSKVFVYYKEIGYTEIVELPNYTWKSLVFNIGGALGLFLGMSILSVVELIELLVRLFTSNSKQYQQQKRNRNTFTIIYL
jgi:hypothetical protein